MGMDSAIRKYDAIQLFGPDMLANPYPIYHRLRGLEPVHWHEGFQGWILTRYEDVANGLHDLRLSNERAELMGQMAGSPGLKSFFDFISNRMLFCDPPRHTRLRTLVNKAFTPHAIDAMGPHIQTLVDGFLDKVQARGRIDIIADLAFPLPATVIAEMLGVPPADRDQLKQWSDEFVAFFSTAPNQVPLALYEQGAAAARAMTDYFHGIVARLRSQATQGLLVALEEAQEQGDRLTADELYANANLLLVAGHETTTNLIGNGMLALLRHPDQLRKLQGDASLLPSAVEEFLRYDGPVQFTHRVAKEDVTIGGKLVRKGQFVYLMLAAANRDPEQFPDPDRLDITRNPTKHLAFGGGHHFCLGAPLARLEARIAFGTLLRRLPKMRLINANLAYRENFNLHGVKSLPVEF